MNNFIKIYSGYDVENEVNEYARKRHLNIVSSSMAINQGKIFLTVVYEKPCIELRKKAKTEAETEGGEE